MKCDDGISFLIKCSFKIYNPVTTPLSHSSLLNISGNFLFLWSQMNVWLLHWSLQKHHWLELGSLTRSWSCHQKSVSQWNIFQFNVRLIIEACKLFIFMHLTVCSVMNVGKRHLLHNLDMNWIEEADWWWLRLWIPQDSDVWYDFIIHQPSETTSAILLTIMIMISSSLFQI